MVKWSSFLVSEWLDLLVSSVKVTIVLELYRRKWQGGNIYGFVNHVPNFQLMQIKKHPQITFVCLKGLHLKFHIFKGVIKTGFINLIILTLQPVSLTKMAVRLLRLLLYKHFNDHLIISSNCSYLYLAQGCK